MPPTRAVADRDEEGLVGDRREAQQARRALRAASSAAAVESIAACGVARRTSRSIRGGLPSSDVERHVDGRGRRTRESSTTSRPSSVGLADHRERAALAAAQRREASSPPADEREHVALLRLVAPDLERRHARLVARHLAQVDARRRAGCARRLRAPRSTGRRRRRRGSSRIGLCVAQRPAAIDDFLRAALDLGVAALHRGEVEIARWPRPLPMRGRRAAAEADQHRRTAEHDDAARRAGISRFSTCMRRTLPRPPAIMIGL